MAGIGDRKLALAEVLDEGVVMAPFSGVINTTNDPDAVLGDIIHGQAIARTSAGLFTFTLNNLPYSVVGGSIGCSCGATEDITPHIDWSAATTTGVITLRFQTGATATDPADNTVFGGCLFLKKTDRKAGV